MRKTYSFVVLAMFASISEAKSQQHSFSKAYFENYVEGGVGFALPSSNKMSMSGSLFGKSASASGSIEYDTGIAVSAIFGKTFSSLLAVEGEFNYTTANISYFRGGYTIGSSSGSGKSALSGSIDTGSFLTNLILTPFSTDSYKLFVGAGVGVGIMLTTIDTIGSNDVGATIPAPYFAADIVAGVQYKLAQNLDIGARYQWMMMTPGGDGGVSAANISLTNTDMHQFKGTLTFRF